MDASEAVRRPTVHGLYDCWHGGGQHMRADRELARAIEEEFPSVPAHVQAAKDFHLRAARWCAERGISRFIRAGAVTWTPGGRNIHEAVREINPGARTVYVNKDREAHAWACELLAGPGAETARAPFSRPAELLSAPPVAAMLAGAAPVCMITGLILQFAPARSAAQRIADYAAALPSGSVLAVSLALPPCTPRADRLMAMFAPAARVYRHTAADVARWMADAGLEMVPPGVTDVRLLPGCPQWAAENAIGIPGGIGGALGVVP